MRERAHSSSRIRAETSVRGRNRRSEELGAPVKISGDKGSEGSEGGLELPVVVNMGSERSKPASVASDRRSSSSATGC